MNLSAAVSDFRRARRKASLQKIFARFSKKSVDLLSYEEVSRKLRAIESGRKELKEIPLDSIVGSVGRYKDFTRGFLPKRDSDEQRWARVEIAMTDFGGLPPIEVYQIGKAYFVLDGNHRVSVARQMKAPSIEAYVKEVYTKVELSPEDQADDVILKFEYTEFLDHTSLDKLRPEADLRATIPGRYEMIEEHITVHRYFMGIDQDREIHEEEAVAHWHDEVYMPIVRVIRERGILRDFPGRTESDLYLWISKHRASLEEQLEWEIDFGTAAEDLVDEFSPDRRRVVSRLGRKVVDAVTPDILDAGPPAGEWRKESLTSRRPDRLFFDVLAPVSGDEQGWRALDQAIEVVQKEGGRLRGLFVLSAEHKDQTEQVQSVRVEFQQRCENAGLEGALAVEVGGIARKISERAQWNDLVVLNLAHPPSKRPLAKLSSGFRTLVRRCPRPILAVKGKPSMIKKALLAYDGSPKAKEALYIAAYIAGRWETTLVVLTVDENEENANKILQQSASYLEDYGSTAKLIHRTGEVADAILHTGNSEFADLVIMGGYGMNPVTEVALGSAVDQVMREGEIPILICR
jgi:nucleotide-binding universal stress UspA family protein